MRKIMCFFIFISNFLVRSNNVNVQNQYVSRAYIVLDASNNKVVEGKEIHLIRSVASVSKIMTAIVALESGNLDREVFILKEDLDTYGSSVYLQEGEIISLKDLLYGLLLRSGNDASLAIARVVGGTIDNFITMMNDKAKKLEMKDTIFHNPSGLDVEEDGNLSSAYDLALMMSYAIQNEEFIKISGAKEYRSGKRLWKNKNKLLHSYDKLIAGKTGFTYKARRTLVTAARNKNTTFIAVTLDCGNDFNFHRFLYEKSFNKYETIKVLDKGDNFYEEYVVISKKSLYVTVEKEKEYSLLYLISDNLATIYLIEEGRKIEIAKVTVVENERKIKYSFWDKLINKST